MEKKEIVSSSSFYGSIPSSDENHFFPSRWYFRRDQREEPIDDLSSHYTIRDGCLTILGAQETDSGSYICTTSNAEGSASMEIRLSVSAPLSVHVQPAVQTVDLGKPASLVSQLWLTTRCPELLLFYHQTHQMDAVELDFLCRLLNSCTYSTVTWLQSFIPLENAAAFRDRIKDLGRDWGSSRSTGEKVH